MDLLMCQLIQHYLHFTAAVALLVFVVVALAVSATS
jgi:hypothetical protein